MRTDHAMETPELMAAAYRAEMARLLAVIDRIPADRLGDPIMDDWSVNEVLVHLAAWDRAIAASADDVLAGRPARLTAMRLEDVNEDVVESRRGAPLEDARADLAEAHQGLLDRLAAITPEQWQTSVPATHWRDGSEMTTASVFAYQYRGQTHYGGHADEIEEWLGEG